MGDMVEPFTVRVNDADLEDLRLRLVRTCLPEPIAGDSWDAGMPIAYLRELIGYWLGTYDWRRKEAHLNRFPHFTTAIDGQSIRFIHARSPHEDALPLHRDDPFHAVSDSLARRAQTASRPVV